MAHPRMHAEIGRVLGDRYRLVAPIGLGASAQVFLADDVRLRRRVALKMLHESLADEPDFLRRFRAEAQAAAALSHPNVLAVFDWSGDEIPYIVTEYLGGGSLRSLLDSAGTLSASQALAVGLDAARALDYAHRRGFVHRDVKPANLLFGEDERLRVGDFGLARALAEAAWTEPEGAMLGTARYASPEQARGEALSGKADVYSLALVLVEAVSGAVPFQADTTLGTLMARVDRPIPTDPVLGPLRDAIELAGDPDPDQRIDARGLAAALLRAAEGLPRPAALPLAGALAEGVSLAEPDDPTIHDPGGDGSEVAGASPADPPAEQGIGDLTAEDLDLDPPAWVSGGPPPLAVAGAVGAGLGIDPEPDEVRITLDGAQDPDVVDDPAGEDLDDEPTTLSGFLRGDVDDAGVPVEPTDDDLDPAEAAADMPSEGPSADSWAASDGVDPDATALTDAPELDDYDDGDDLEDPYEYEDDYPSGEYPDDDYESGEYDYGYDGIDERDTAEHPPAEDWEQVPRRRRRWPIYLSVVLALALIGVSAGILLTGGDDGERSLEPFPNLPIPEMGELDQAQLEALYSAGGWEVEWVLGRQNDTEAGQIIGMDPRPGTRLPKGRAVKITVSVGQELMDVPTGLEGRPREEVEAAIVAAELVPTVAGEEHHEEIEAGSLIRYADETPAQVERGHEVGMIISAGPRPRTVPGNQVGGDPADAVAAIEAEQLVARIVEEHSDDIAEGRVIRLGPAGGSEVPRGSTVDIVVSLGPELVIVPDVSEFDDISDANAALREVGLVPGEVSGPAEGSPQSTNPAAGSEVRKGSTVNIRVG